MQDFAASTASCLKELPWPRECTATTLNACAMDWLSAPSIRFTIHEDWAVIDNGCELFCSNSYDECKEWRINYMKDANRNA